jgi:hypothetical protein
MKALSIRQPFASRILRGEKRIEVRSWPTEYRGPLVIVSSKRRPSPSDIKDREADIPMPCGVAMVLVDLVDCHPMTAAEAAKLRCERSIGRTQSWILANPRPLKPFSVTGKLRFFEVSEAKVKAARRHAARQ